MTVNDPRPEPAATPAARLAPAAFAGAGKSGATKGGNSRRSTTVTPAKAGAHP